MDATIGKFFGKYQVLEPLGEGGMATVYKAYDASLERYVAIKIIRQISQQDPSFLARFHREAKALAKLDHPYILKILDYGEEDGIPYLVMPYVANGTLKQYTRNKLSYKRAIQLMLPIAEALGYAHQHKIIHRDIKPANILFGESGEPVLSDFGIAKIIDAGEETQLTNAGVGIGTPDYMAPEQWNGIADERTDVYALGIVLYELITGRCPFHADTPAAILLKQVQDPLPRPKSFVPTLPEGAEGLLIKALAKDPHLRFQSMQEFITAMNRLLRGEFPGDGSQNQTRIPDRMMQQTAVASVPSKIPVSTGEIMQGHNSSRKWLPWAIGGGAFLTIGCVIIVVITGLLQSNLLGRKTPTALLAPMAETQNNADTVVSTEPAATQVEPTQEMRLTPINQSVDSIDKLPDDIPVFTPNNGDVVISEAEQMQTFSYSSNSEHTEIETFFIQEMANRGWILENTTEMSSQGLMMYAFSKDPRSVVVYVMSITLNDGSVRTTIQIMIAK